MPSGPQWDQALRDVALWIIESGTRSPEGVAPIVQAGHPALRAVATPYEGQLSDDELAALVSSVVADVGATSLRDMGAVMKEATGRAGASADGKKLSALVRAALS